MTLKVEINGETEELLEEYELDITKCKYLGICRSYSRYLNNE
jgi:hypothetical protein